MRISKPRSLFFVLFAVTGCGLIVGTSDDYPPPTDASMSDDAMVKVDGSGGSAGNDATGGDTGPLVDAPSPEDAPDAPDAPDDASDDAPDDAMDAVADSPADVVEAGGDGGRGPENCTNGKDDNGDGLVDCEDPECQAGFTCGSPLLPSGNGWTLGVFDETGRPACPTGYNTQRAVISSVQGTGPATCACQCDTNAPAQCAGDVWFNNNGGGGAACRDPTQGGHFTYLGNFFSGAGACDKNAPQNIGSNLKWSTSGTSHTVAGTCTPHDVASIPQVSANHGETCVANAHGAGCGGGACVAKPTNGFQICAFKSGAACPNGLVPTTANVGDGVNDPRGCGGCACGTSDLGCSYGGMQFYPDSNCMNQTGDFYIPGGQCVPSNPAGNFGSLGALGTQTNNTQCAPTSNSVSNNQSASPTGAALTICCPP